MNGLRISVYAMYTSGIDALAHSVFAENPGRNPATRKLATARIGTV
jgi:hypothetical protein